MDRRCWTSEIVNLIDFNVEREAYVVAHKIEARIGQKVAQFAPCPGIEIVRSAPPSQNNEVAHYAKRAAPSHFRRCGSIGSRLCEQLLAPGYEVLCVRLSSAGAAPR